MVETVRKFIQKKERGKGKEGQNKTERANSWLTEKTSDSGGYTWTIKGDTTKKKKKKKRMTEAGREMRCTEQRSACQRLVEKRTNGGGCRSYPSTKGRRISTSLRRDRQVVQESGPERGQELSALPALNSMEGKIGQLLRTIRGGKV